ncbi:hypothetical protein GUITHDRAFT_152963 [Guillardia theta CCMP2712]|uniref:Uncharacterized protein n=1 Tax=Guillardia theta (strain CCMP2712) TaxID=905079 RepID=L1J7C9_GUITC|nr:hypothetical protein GUITHDRAFT_152963 [Guillardia theta CCMP2712]EKX44443.1 hypothetical protein GUITHDRAFT_152963 [Guillardia theta CCMP2712]|eukprot:XP_005831423.1 hypothetical protein GUITHDRAFT_152963 [Guillardia theta CCMP2712]
MENRKLSLSFLIGLCATCSLLLLLVRSGYKSTRLVESEVFEAPAYEMIPVEPVAFRGPSIYPGSMLSNWKCSKYCGVGFSICLSKPQTQSVNDCVATKNSCSKYQCADMEALPRKIECFEAAKDNYDHCVKYSGHDDSSRAHCKFLYADYAAKC